MISSASITKKQIQLAGWLSITNYPIQAIIDYLVFSVVLPLTSDFKNIEAEFDYLTLVLTVVHSFFVIWFLYIFLPLKNLLIYRWQFQRVDKYISLFIWSRVAVALTTVTVVIIINLIPNVNRQYVGNILRNLLIFPVVIPQILFAAKLLNLPGKPYSLLKLFAVTLIILSLCTFVSPFGNYSYLIRIFTSGIQPFFGIISDVILGIILLKASKQLA